MLVMEWKVLKVKILPKNNQVLILESGEIRVIAHVNTHLALKQYDIISPIKNAFYTINYHQDNRLKFLSACKFTPECWKLISTLAKQSHLFQLENM